MKKEVLLSALIFLLNTSFCCAVIFYGDSTDEEHRALGVNFPSVGYFAIEDEKPFGSGALINTNIESLNGRVVLTAGHVLKNKPDTISFHIGSQKRRGHAIIHPSYFAFDEENKPYDIPYFPYDIALYFLNEPIQGIPLAVLNLDLDFDLLLRKKWFAICGFGISGQPNALSEETDMNRRACYSYASRKLNVNATQNSSVSYRCIQDGNVVKEIDLCHPADSVLTLTPDCFLEPCGSVAAGDSGGGLFLPENGQLVGVIVGTSETEIKGCLQINPLNNPQIHLEDDALDTAYKARLVLVRFHREWLKNSFDVLAAESSASGLKLLDINTDLETKELRVTLSINGSSYSHTATTFSNSEDTMSRALHAKALWSFVTDKDVSPEIRYVAAMRLFESANQAIHRTGCVALLKLASDFLMSENLRDQAASKLFKSDSPLICRMGIKAYLCIVEHSIAPVRLRIDAALKLIFEVTDLFYRARSVDFYLALAEKDPRRPSFCHGVFVLLNINDDLGAYIVAKLSSLLEDEHTDGEKKKIIRNLFKHRYGIDISHL